MKTPVALIFFNRPKVTELVFAEIAKAKPTKLFLIADGPRKDRTDDIENSMKCREIVQKVNWDCEVLTNFSDTNLGVGRRPASGIDWVFEHVDRAIIFEDDCIPHPTFFPFCEELLNRYQDNHKVMHISGWTPVESYFKRDFPHSYYFSRALSGHGWATWARAWKHFDFDMLPYPEFRKTNWLLETLGDKKMAKFMSQIFDRIYHSTGRGKGWDQQWNFAVWAHNGLGIRPAVNLIDYKGFDTDATHRFWARKNEYFDQPARAMTFPLRHPQTVIRDFETDMFIYSTFFASRPRKNRLERFYKTTRKKIRHLIQHELPAVEDA